MVLLAILLATLLATACRTPATQVQLFIDTDAPLDRGVTIEVFSFRGAVPASELAMRAHFVTMGTLRLVRVNSALDTFVAGGSIGVLPPADGTTNAVTLWLRATFAATPNSPPLVVDRAAAVRFIRGSSRTGRVFLRLSCGDQAVGCVSVSAAQCTVSVRCREQNATCGDLGECVAVEIPVAGPDSDGAVDDTPTSGVDATSMRADTGLADGALPTADNVSDGPEDVAVCPMGTTSVGGRCIVEGAFPRQILPVSLGDVSLRRPTLRWQLPAETDGAMVELCRDRACAMVIERIRAPGSFVRPSTALPPSSVVFWRLQATVGASTAASYSPTWLFHVPATDNRGAIDTSSNPHLDVNGDGYDDVIVGASQAPAGGATGAGAARVYHGSASGIPMIPARVLVGAVVDDQFGVAVAGAGDVNGDGFGDIVVGAWRASAEARGHTGTASVYHGSAGGIAMTPTRVLEGVADGDLFRRTVASASDVNGDGYADIVIGARKASPGAREFAGTASVYFGSASGIPMAPTTVLEGTTAGDQFGSAVASARDINADGFADIVVGAFQAAPGSRMNAGTASVFHGSAGGISMTPARLLEGVTAGDIFGFSVASVLVPPWRSAGRWRAVAAHSVANLARDNFPTCSQVERRRASRINGKT